MFTGLVHGAAKVVGLYVRSADGARLTLDHPLMASAKPGDSIAVNGCCLTVVEPRGAQASFDLLAETLRLTNLGGLTAGAVVNVEPSLQASDRLGGHFVTGHIDACGTVVRFEKVGADWRLDVRAPLPFPTTRGAAEDLKSLGNVQPMDAFIESDTYYAKIPARRADSGGGAYLI